MIYFNLMDLHVYTVVAIWYPFILFSSWRRAKPRTLNRRNRPTVPVYFIAPFDFSHPYRGNRSTVPVYWTDRQFLLFY